MLKYLAATSFVALVSLFLALRPQLFDLPSFPDFLKRPKLYSTMAAQSVSRSVVKKVLAIEQNEVRRPFFSQV